MREKGADLTACERAKDHFQIANTNNTTGAANMANPIHGDGINGRLNHNKAVGHTKTIGFAVVAFAD